jgi:hypothetical protein
VQVVDREHERPFGGQVERQPVEPVQRGKRGIARPLAALTDLLEDAARAALARRERPLALLGVDQRRLEQLADDAEGEPTLELAPRAPRARIPSSIANRLASASRLDLPIPGRPSITATPPWPSAASLTRPASAPTSRCRSIRPSGSARGSSGAAAPGVRPLLPSGILF